MSYILVLKFCFQEKFSKKNLKLNEAFQDFYLKLISKNLLNFEKQHKNYF